MKLEIQKQFDVAIVLCASIIQTTGIMLVDENFVHTVMPNIRRMCDELSRTLKEVENQINNQVSNN